jgi:DNA-binding IclR family transcriptional regulator
MMEFEKRASVKSLVKALKILKMFEFSKPKWTVKELSDTLGYHKSSIQRLTSTLETEGFIERSQEDKARYQLGPQMRYLSNAAIQNVDLRQIARPFLERLSRLTQEVVHLCVVEQLQCYYIDKIDSPRSIRLVTHVGQRLHLHCTGVGKVLMSGMSPSDLDRVIQDKGLPAFTPNTITIRDRLMEELKRIRYAGIAYDSEEFEIGLKCIAGPIINSQGKVIAAVSVSGPTQRLSSRVIDEFSTYVKEAAREISMKLGYQMANGTDA